MKALSRYEVLDRTYYLDSIKSDINDVMNRYADNTLADPGIKENMD